MKTYTPEELKEIVRLHKMWLRRKEGGVMADLRGAYLPRVDLSGVDLSGANLVNANLAGATLQRVNLCNVNLTCANLRGSDLGNAMMLGVVLRNADMGGANLAEAYLQAADLSGAKLQHANLRAAVLGHASLRSAYLDNAVLTDADFTNTNITYCAGIQYTQLAFQGLAAGAQQWNVVKIDGVWKVFCGHWSGSLAELRDRIAKECAKYRVSQEIALRSIELACEYQDSLPAA